MNSSSYFMVSIYILINFLSLKFSSCISFPLPPFSYLSSCMGRSILICSIGGCLIRGYSISVNSIRGQWIRGHYIRRHLSGRHQIEGCRISGRSISELSIIGHLISGYTIMEQSNRGRSISRRFHMDRLATRNSFSDRGLTCY